VALIGRGDRHAAQGERTCACDEKLGEFSHRILLLLSDARERLPYLPEPPMKETAVLRQKLGIGSQKLKSLPRFGQCRPMSISGIVAPPISCGCASQSC
jgi:hypothetical protein